ncbi:hypothetical protein I317_02467 [Kwoniella heveanensis CBS 569]|nr:hypothetical protein I317_02467 [Kwoniella heveanensis CBS 569]
MSCEPHRDLLGYSPARPQTTIPGHWILDLPITTVTSDSSSDTHEQAAIHVRRFRAAFLSVAVDAGPGPSSSTKREGGHVDGSNTNLFEAAWRAIAEGQPSSSAAGTSDENLATLNHPCGIITSEPLGDVRERVLWVFSTTAEDMVVPHGLQEIEPRLPPMNIPNLLTCSNHGQNPSCFYSSPEAHRQQPRSCEITLSSSEQARRNLDLLGAAVVERMAWKAGWRLCLHPSLERPTSSTSTSLEPLLLNPLRLPALRISNLSPSLTQESRLSAAFDLHYGYSWKSGRQEALTRARMLGETYTEWSVYWVPLITDQRTLSPKQLGKLSPRQLSDRWRQGSGVLTVWPTHLAEPFYLNTTAPPSNPVVLGDYNVKTKSSDLLDIASDVFDFLSNYREPEVVEEVEDDPDPVEEDVTMDGESNIEPNSITDGLDTGNDRSPHSDIDDLFSAHSDSPGNDGTPLATVKPSSPLRIDEKMVEAVDYEPPRAPVRREQGSEAEEKPEQREEIMVTEDDFAFFDSPTDQVDGLSFVGLLNDGNAPPNGHAMTADEGMDIDLNAIFGGTIDGFSKGCEGSPEHPAQSAQSMNMEAPAAPDAAGTSVERVPQPAQIDDRPVEASTSTEGVIASQPVQLPPSPALSLHKRSYSTTDLVPPSFSPLPLLPLQSSQYYNYAFPSPAPTPSSLREDLVQRLKPPQSRTATYADVWEMESEPSAMDEEEEFTGPPTPESAYSDESETEDRPAEKKGSEEDINDFGGVQCLSTEWLEYIYLPEKVQTLAKQWDLSWVTSSLLPVAMQEADAGIASDSASAIALKGIDCVRFVRDLLSNKVSRSICASGANEKDFAAMNAQSLVEQGVVLSDLSPSSSLAQPQIHAGYFDSVIKLSISALHYWVEIGLQPQGGPKDVEGVVVCDKDEVSKAAGGQLLLEVKRAWESLRLGKYRVSELAGNNRGVVSVSSSGISETVADLLNQVSHNTVIYVLLPPESSSIISVIRGLYSLALSPSPSTIMRLIPRHALSQDRYRELAMDIYDGLPLPVRAISHAALDPNLDHNPDQSRVVPAHAFTLARTELPKPEFSMSWPLKSYDVLNTQRSTHGCYTIVEEYDVMIACVMDDLGEAFELNIWQDIGKMEVKSRVKQVFEWFKDRTEEWIIQWKGSVTRVGAVALDEIRIWNNILDKTSLPLTFLVVDPPSHGPDPSVNQIPRPRGLTNIPPATMNDPNASLIDLSLTGQITAFSSRLPLTMQAVKPDYERNGASNPYQTDIVYPQSCFLLTISDEMGHKSISTVYNVMNHSKGLRSELEARGKDHNKKLGEELYRLNCLIRRRHGLEGMDGILSLAERGLRGLSSMGQGKEGGVVD